jgi:PAS domain S-box-containing protein
VNEAALAALAAGDEPLAAACVVAWSWAAAAEQAPCLGLASGWTVHPDDMARLGAAGAAALSGEDGTFLCEHRVLDAAGQVRWVESRGRVAHGRIVGASIDVTPRRQREDELRASAERRRLLAEVTAEGVCLHDGLHLLEANESLARMFGYGSADWAVTRVLEGQSFSDLEVRLRRLDKEHECWVSYNGTAVRDPDGSVALAILTMRDITARKKAEERQALLLAELSHRVKNTLAVVQGIAARSLATDRPPAEGRDAFTKRLRALARAHSLLTATEWRGASLRAVVASELQPYGERAVLSGPELMLEPRAALTLALALHELATNAAKHGALSAPEGRVEVAWSVEHAPAHAPELRLTWREHDGPPVRPPAQRGFGSALVEQGLRHDLDNTAVMEFRPDGLACELTVPVAGALAASQAT